MDRVRIAVSACLLGENVRYDGGHKYDSYVAEELAAHCELVPLCPEMEAGMGVPREPVHLVGDPAAPRMIGNQSGEDWTVRVGALVRERVTQLGAMRIAGCVLKSRSPSCGIDGVDVAAEDGRLEPIGRGLLAAQLRRQLPSLPVEQERGLHDVGRREHFVVRVFAHHRLDDLLATDVADASAAWGLVAEFHRRESYLLTAHNPRNRAELDRLVAVTAERPPADLRARYADLYTETMRTCATVVQHVAVLQRILRDLRVQLTARTQEDLTAAIADYHDERTSLIDVMNLIERQLETGGRSILRDQSYFAPAPVELWPCRR